jgi:hypothetical protein
MGRVCSESSYWDLALSCMQPTLEEAPDRLMLLGALMQVLTHRRGCFLSWSHGFQLGGSALEPTCSY